MSQESMGGQEGAPAGTALTAGIDYVTPAGQTTYVTANAAPIAAQYLTLAANAALTVERVFTPSTGLTAVDGGAGAAYTLTVDLATGKAGGQTVYGGVAAGENLTLSSTAHATKGKVYLGAALTVWADGVDGNARFNVDTTGLATTVPVLVKNGKALSGVEVQVTGTAATGYVLRDSAGVQQGAFGLAGAAGDWTPTAAAGDVVIAGPAAAGKGILIKLPTSAGNTGRITLLSPDGVLGTNNEWFAMDQTNGLRMGVNTTSLTIVSAITMVAGATILAVASAGVTVTGNLIAPTVYGSAASAGNLTLASTTHATPGNVTMTSGSAGTLSQFVASAASGTKMSYGPSVSLTMATTSAFVGPVTMTGYLNVNGLTLIDAVAGGITMYATPLATGATAGFPILRTMAGTPTGAVADGAFVIDTTASKVWARVGGAWKSVAIA
jgi:hypothetical protein